MKLELSTALLAERPHLFSDAVMPIAQHDLNQMTAIIAAVESVIARPQWAQKVGVGETAQAGVFMGYDFHLTAAGPQLIEINTNAGGGLLAAWQAGRTDVLAAYVDMFRAECPGTLKTLAIVDEAPEAQYLYPEFLGFQQLFAAHGIEAIICAPDAFVLREGRLWIGDVAIDLVYNRLTDFALNDPAHAVLRTAWEEGAVVVTPNPVHHARYADKQNLIALTDAALLASWGVDATTRALLQAGIPHTEAVTPARGEDFWQRRRQLFFKPATGYGSKGAYRGDKLTKRVFDEILAGDYVAQALALPSTLPVEVAGELTQQLTELKADVRNYVYRGAVQLVAARLYQGQTTNFRTPGGGFAKVVAT